MQRYRKYKHMKRLLTGTVYLLMVLFNACGRDDVGILPDQLQEEILLTFSVKLPSVPQGVKTYALEPEDENSLQDIDVLVFTDDAGEMKFRYRSVGSVVEQSS